MRGSQGSPRWGGWRRSSAVNGVSLALAWSNVFAASRKIRTLGALLLEIAYALAMTFVSTATAGALMRLAMTGILRSKN